jgi:CO/xanthine dehydrogenase Mo-binding subunit
MSRYVGSDLGRPDAAGKASGRALYIHDIARPGMLYGAIKHAGHAHARIVSIDTSKAERLPGVRAVLTAKNTPEIRMGFLRDNVVLKGDKVRQQRDEVAAVAATDPDIARAALDLIEIEYAPLPAVFTPEAAMAAGAPLLHERDARGKPLDTNRMNLAFRHKSGDLDAGRRAAKHIVQGEFKTQLIQQCCMGTAGSLAEFDLNGNLTIWAKTQIPFLAQRDFNDALAQMGLKDRNSRVIVPAMGGGFGTGLDTHIYEYISILLAHATGRPVKVLMTRREEFAFLSPRQSAEVRITQGCDAEGMLTFREIHVVQDNGAYASWGATYPSVMLMPATSLYQVRNVSFDCDIIYTNNTYCQAMRGYGNPELNWALESNMDELAEAAGIDAVDLRQRNVNEPDTVTPMGLEITTCGLRECINETANGLKWTEKRGKSQHRRRGVGLASLIHVGGSGRIYQSDASGIHLRFDDYGNLYVSSGGVEMGQGLHAALTAVLADGLGVRPDKIFINQTDTATCPWDVGTHASRGAFTACNAALQAAKKMQAQIFTLAAEILPKEISKNLHKFKKRNPDFTAPDLDLDRAQDPANLRMSDSRITVDGFPDAPWAGVDLARLARAVHFRANGTLLTAEAFYDPPTVLPDWSVGVGNMSATYTFGCQGVEVEVDTDTGDVFVRHMVNAMDVGKVLNPTTLEGQLYGGIAQGLGYALYEQVITTDGEIRNPDFRDYKVPTAVEMDFPIDLVFVETNDPAGPFGAKGVGEPGLVPTAPAIANAIYDAVGVRIRELPITPERVLEALARKAAAEREAAEEPEQ